MRKEIIIGLSVIGVLLATLAGMVCWRMNSVRTFGASDESVAMAPLKPIPIPQADADSGTGGDSQAIERDWAPAAHTQQSEESALQEDSQPMSFGSPEAAQSESDTDAPSALDQLPDGPEAMPTGAADPFRSAGAGAVESQNALSTGQEEEGAAVESQADTEAESAQWPEQTKRPQNTAGRIRSTASQAGTVPTSGTLADSPAAFQQGSLDEESPNPYADASAQPGALGPYEGGPKDGRYVVAPNDNYWTISEKVYGSGGYFKAIREHNRLRFPSAEKLQVGDALEVPNVSVMHERYPDLCPKSRRAPPARQTLTPASARHHVGEKVYVVSEGDSLFDIARYELGKASRWTEIYDLNRDVLGEDFDYLRPGTELVMPPDRRSTDSVTRSPGSGYQR